MVKAHCCHFLVRTHNIPHLPRICMHPPRRLACGALVQRSCVAGCTVPPGGNQPCGKAIHQRAQGSALDGWCQFPLACPATQRSTQQLVAEYQSSDSQACGENGSGIARHSWAEGALAVGVQTSHEQLNEARHVLRLDYEPVPH